MSIGQEIERFLDQSEARSLHTAKTYRNGLNRFTSFLAEREIQLSDPVDKLNLRLPRDFVTWLGRQKYQKGDRISVLAMRSRANYAMAVSSLYRMLVMDGMAGFTYSDYLVVHKAVQEATRYNDVPIEKKLPPEEVMSAILDAIQAPPQIDLHLKAQRRWRLHMVWLRNRALILGLYSTGMRISELLGLRRQDLDYSAQGAWVTGKGDKTRFVRFSRQAWQAIEAYLVERNDNSVGLPSSMPVICRHDRATGDFRRQPMSPVSAERAVTALAKETGVLERFNLTPHSFRHYFATKFLRATGDLALTQDVMGHADPATTRLYAKTSQAQHIKAHQALFDE